MAAGRSAIAAYPLLLALGALDATGYSVIVPVAPAIADATGAGPATIGLLVASFPAGMQFYARFHDEVIAEPQVIAAHVERAREQVSDSFRQIFDEALVDAHRELVSNPRDLAAKVRFVTIYHMVIEGTLGLMASHFILDYLRERELLPSFTEGYGRIASDEGRHIAYGTWFLREAVGADPDMANVIRGQIRELLPAVAESISPPSEGGWDVLGVGDGALAEFALGALNRRLKLIGAPLDA